MLALPHTIVVRHCTGTSHIFGGRQPLLTRAVHALSIPSVFVYRARRGLLPPKQRTSWRGIC